MKGGHRDTAIRSLDQIPYDVLAREEVCDNAQLFYILASASFIETTSDLYARNLVEFLSEDAEAVAWLIECWQRDELAHGAALKRYVITAWPEFDWEGTYRAFSGEYRETPSVYQLAATPAREMVTRCVVETGTTTFYRMLAASTTEPVLRQMALAIAAEEVRHYKHFYRYFMRFQAQERLSRGAVLRTIWNRAAEIHADDSFIAFKHVYRARNPDVEVRVRDYQDFRIGLRRLARDYYPYDLAVKMLTQPLNLNGVVKRVAVPAATSAARLLLAA